MRDLKQMEVLTQSGPSCGTTSLAMIIRFLNEDDNLTRADIDREIRKLPNMFSAPSDLIAYARTKGLQAVECNNGSIEQLEEFVSRGIPVMPLLDLTPENALDFSKWHWVVVVAVEEIAGRKMLTVNNPWGRQEVWQQGKFTREWAYLKLLGLTFGYNNYFIAVAAPADTMPACNVKNTRAGNAVIKGLADILNGFAAVKDEGNMTGIGKILAGVFRLIYGLFGTIGNNILRLAGLASGS
jgi:hypothetical protein